MLVFDLSVLEKPLTPEEVRGSRSNNHREAGSGNKIRDDIAFAAIVNGMIASVLVVMLLPEAATSPVRSLSGRSFALLLIWATVAGVVVAASAAAPAVSLASERRRVLLGRFAACNHLEYTAQATVGPEYRGLLSRVGFEKVLSDRFRLRTVRRTEVGNFRVRHRRHFLGLSSRAPRGGYVELTLERPMPQLLLRRTARQALPALWLRKVLEHGQRLKLEGSFTVYCPRGGEASALYVLTPDVMQLILTKAKDYDIEFVDTSVFLYRARPFDFRRPDTWKTVADLIGSLAPKMERHSINFAAANPSSIDRPEWRRSTRIRVSRVPVTVGAVLFAAFILYCGYANFYGIPFSP